jgi:hypothetical protein
MHKIKAFFGCIWQNAISKLRFPTRRAKSPQKLRRLGTLGHPLYIFWLRAATNLPITTQHVYVAFTGEKRLTVKHLAEDATNRPEIHSTSVLLRQKHYLGCAVPPRDYVLGKYRLVLAHVVIRFRHVATC